MKLTCDFAAIEIKEGRGDVCDLLARGESVPFTIRGKITGKLTEDDGEGQEFTAEIDSIATRQEYDEAQRTIRMLRNSLRPFANIPYINVGTNKFAPFYWVVIGAPNRQSFTREDVVEARRVIEAVKDI